MWRRKGDSKMDWPVACRDQEARNKFVESRFCTGVGAPTKITRRMWKWSTKRCKGILINVRRRKPRMSTENSTPKKYSSWRKKGGNIEGLLNWNGHLARLQWCMASSMIHGNTPFQYAWFILLKAREEIRTEGRNYCCCKRLDQGHWLCRRHHPTCDISWKHTWVCSCSSWWKHPYPH